MAARRFREAGASSLAEVAGLSAARDGGVDPPGVESDGNPVQPDVGVGDPDVGDRELDVGQLERSAREGVHDVAAGRDYRRDAVHSGGQDAERAGRTRLRDGHDGGRRFDPRGQAFVELLERLVLLLGVLEDHVDREKLVQEVVSHAADPLVGSADAVVRTHAFHGIHREKLVARHHRRVLAEARRPNRKRQSAAHGDGVEHDIAGVVTGSGRGCRAGGAGSACVRHEGAVHDLSGAASGWGRSRSSKCAARHGGHADGR